jgi:hypothetical protein
VFDRPSAISFRTSSSRGGQHVEPLGTAVAQELSDDLGVEGRAATCDAPDRIDEVGDLEHAVLDRIVVGPPSGLSTVRVPSSASTRRRRPTRPFPDASALPVPSSMIATSSVPFRRATEISTRPAPECFAALGDDRRPAGDHESQCEGGDRNPGRNEEEVAVGLAWYSGRIGAVMLMVDSVCRSGC